MRCSSVGLFVAVMVSMLSDEVRGFEHLKHKFKLKKLAKLAFAARLLAPHLIPLPIPLPIIRRNRNKHTFKVIEETDPWKGQGWEMPEGWDYSAGQGGWNFEGGSGWQQMQGWQMQGQMAFPEGWNSQQSFDGHFQKNSFRQQSSIPSLKGEEFGSGGQHSHQVEIREEIVPALKAAGFFGDPNGVMTKMHHRATSAVPNSLADSPRSGKSRLGGRSQGRDPATHGWSASDQSQLAEVLKVKEIKDARVVHSPPFDVQNGKLGHFDVSGVPVQSFRAPKQTDQIDPWPHNVADSPVHDAAVRNHFDSDQDPDSNQERPGGDGGAAGHDTGFEDVAPEDKLIFKEERHQAQDSQSHANVSPDIPHSLSLQQFQNEQGWLPMVTSMGREPLPPAPTPPAERDAHKRK